MSRILLASLFSICLLALSLAPSSEASIFWTPIFEDDIVASVEVGTEVWVVPFARAADLSAYAGTQACQHSLDALLDAIEGGYSPSAVRFEGCHAAEAGAARLSAEGYGTVSSVAPQVNGSSYARQYAP